MLTIVRPALKKKGQRCCRCQQKANHIDSKHLGNVVQGEGFNQPKDTYTGVIHQDIENAVYSLCLGK